MVDLVKKMLPKKKQKLIKKSKKKKNLYEISLKVFLITIRFLYLIINFLNFKYYNIISSSYNKIFFNNFLVYNHIFKILNYSFFLVIFPNFFKINWISNKSFFIKLFYVKNNLNFKNNFFIDKKDTNSKLKNLINLKKKTSLLKKNDDYEYIILNKFDVNKNDIFFNLEDNYNVDMFDGMHDGFDDFFFKNKLEFNKKFIKNSEYFLNEFLFKSMDFKKKSILIYKTNRRLFRKILKVKHKRQHSFNKYINNFIKLNHKSFLFNFEYSLINLLVRSGFFFNKHDCDWFLKNSFISVNGVVEKNSKLILKPMDVVNIVNSSYFYFYYNVYLDKSVNNIYKYNLKIKKINRLKFNPENKKPEKYSNWVYKNMYFGDDIPNFLEVDFISMYFVVLNYSLNYYNLDFYNSKFLNIYLNRVYNWKFII